MKTTNVEAVVNELEARLGPAAPPRRLIDEIAPVAREKFEKDCLDAWAWAEANLVKIQLEIQRREDAARSEGVTWTLDLLGVEFEYVRGACYPDSSIPEREQTIRANRAYATKIADCLRSIKWREFETACTNILMFMGCRTPKTSRASDDGGIDFYGRLELEGRLDDTFPYGGIDRRVHVWLIGQAKHYCDGQVSPGEVRELVGSIELARTGAAVHTWSGLSLRPFDPVVQLFFTTGYFSPRAVDLLVNSGVISMNIDQLSTFLADTGAGIDPDSGKFDINELRRRLLSQIT